MKFYISSYRIGNKSDQLQDMLPKNPKAVYISNALDFSSKKEAMDKHKQEDVDELTALGIEVERLDLREYFGKKEELKAKLDTVDLFYISGGNVFDLRLAMKLSGFDQLLVEEYLNTDKVYGGYSAAGCVLSETLKGYHIVDNTDYTTYGEHETMWEGLGLVDWMFAPHFESNHDESAGINEEVAYYKEHNMPYKTLSDGDVLIFEIKKEDR